MTQGAISLRAAGQKRSRDVMPSKLSVRSWTAYASKLMEGMGGIGHEEGRRNCVAVRTASNLSSSACNAAPEKIWDIRNYSQAADVLSCIRTHICSAPIT